MLDSLYLMFNIQIVQLKLDQPEEKESTLIHGIDLSIWIGPVEKLFAYWAIDPIKVADIPWDAVGVTPSILNNYFKEMSESASCVSSAYVNISPRGPWSGVCLRVS